jgi:hypothetical protein
MKRFVVLLIVLLLITAACFAETAPRPIELGVSMVNFRMQIIDAAQDDQVPEATVYLDLAYESRLMDKTIASHLDKAEELMSLTIFRDEAGVFTGLKSISYETNPITEYPERKNTDTLSWKVLVNGEKQDMAYKVQEDDLVQLVYTASDTLSGKVEARYANKYFFKQNDTVCYDFTMTIKPEAETVLAEGLYKLYVNADKVPEMMVADLIEAVCAHHGLEFHFDGMSVYIGDYIAEQDADGNYHFWGLRDVTTGFGSSLGLGGEWGVVAGAGTHYEIVYR